MSRDSPFEPYGFRVFLDVRYDTSHACHLGKCPRRYREASSTQYYVIRCVCTRERNIDKRLGQTKNSHQGYTDCRGRFQRIQLAFRYRIHVLRISMGNVVYSRTFLARALARLLAKSNSYRIVSKRHILTTGPDRLASMRGLCAQTLHGSPHTNNPSPLPIDLQTAPLPSAARSAAFGLARSHRASPAAC